MGEEFCTWLFHTSSVSSIFSFLVCFHEAFITLEKRACGLECFSEWYITYMECPLLRIDEALWDRERA